MNLRPWHTLAAAVLVVILVGCSAAADPAPGGAAVGPEPAPSPVADDQVEALARRVAELEARLDVPGWTEEDAIRAVQSAFAESVRLCVSNETNCASPVLKGHPGLRVAPGIRGAYIHAHGKTLLEVGRWSAVHEPGDQTWRVEASGGDLRPLVFHVYEKTGVVEGVAPDAPAEETR